MGSGASKKHAELKSNLDSIKLELEACQKAKYELEESYVGAYAIEDSLKWKY